MTLLRSAAAWAAVTGLLVLWRVLESAARGRRPAAAGLGPALPPLAVEGLLLTLFAGLWFGSLGAGGAWLLFLSVGALMEIPWRLGSGTLRTLPWKGIAAGMLRILLAGEVLGLILG